MKSLKPFPDLSLLVLLVALALSLCTHMSVAEDRIEILDQDDDEDAMYVLYDGELSDTQIVSDFPISSLRHNDMNEDSPIGENYMKLVVTSNCDLPLDAIVIDEDTQLGVSITENNAATEEHDWYELDKTSFLEPSQFYANWTYYGGCCIPCCCTPEELDWYFGDRSFPQEVYDKIEKAAEAENAGRALRRDGDARRRERETWSSGRVYMDPRPNDTPVQQPETTRSNSQPKTWTWTSNTVHMTRAGNGRIAARPQDREPINTGFVARPPNRPPLPEPANPVPTPPAPAPTSPAPVPTNPVPAPTNQAPAPTNQAPAPTNPAPAPTNPVQPGPTATAKTKCAVNVEILHNGCRSDSLSVKAPKARILDIDIQTIPGGYTDDRCDVHAHANLTFPTTTDNEQIVQTNMDSYTSLEQLSMDDGYCQMWSYGRPFVDQNGQQVQAHVQIMSPRTARSEEENNPASCDWSASGALADNALNFNATATSLADNNKAEQQRKAYGQEWAERAIGEHASVASFAAFTIALMSNNAPPDLVQDSLVAAQDEVRHAKVSFQAASLFLGGGASGAAATTTTRVEPSALPPSALQFDRDMTALALATAFEGCIHETLSAIIMAIEVDEQEQRLLLMMDQTNDFLKPQEREWLQNQMTIIAKEEASHSALAWRTIHWICVNDKDACMALQRGLLEPTRLRKAARQRLAQDHKGGIVAVAADKIERAWNDIHTVLVPLVTLRDNAADGCDAYYGTKPDTMQTSLASSVSQLLLQNVCSHINGAFMHTSLIQ
ncbi:expressed unknown protein [Seminavis robusta]|uniref:Uncharacterized protein n=1 Tax=Seminavis robusta TaxID=568900 RepID=A0A9N8HSD1_9STRA|nr:expressed unknown protein [Seminavis robusta]|eukprot:Sro1428_g271880.1 n/a (778) ;mRNA; r:18887-21220